MRPPRPAGVLLLLTMLLLVLPACPSDSGEPEAPPGIYAGKLETASGDAIRAAARARREGDALLRAERVEAARESFYLSLQEAKKALPEQGSKEGRYEVLNFLSNTALQIGNLGSPQHLGECVRYANVHLGEKRDAVRPWINKAGAYWRAGMLEESLQAFEMVFDGLGEEDREQTFPALIPNLISVRYSLARRVLLEDRLGAEADARRVLDKAWSLRPSAEENPLVQNLLTQLNKRYAEVANELIDDPLELAKVHARFGFASAGATALRTAEEKIGRNLDVRWVEARYVEEMQGTRPALESAVEHYRRMIARGEKRVFAAAGLARVLYRLGRGQEALDELSDWSELTGDLRHILVILRLERIENREPGDADTAATDLAEIGRLLARGIDEARRGRLLVKVALVALGANDPDRVAWVISELQKRSPRDARIAILDAELRSFKEREAGEERGSEDRNIEERGVEEDK